MAKAKAKAKASYRYLVRVNRITTEYGDIEIDSPTQLTEEEAKDEGRRLAEIDDQDPVDDWNEEEIEFEAHEIIEGEEDLKEED